MALNIYLQDSQLLQSCKSHDVPEHPICAIRRAGYCRISGDANSVFGNSRPTHPLFLGPSQRGVKQRYVTADSAHHVIKVELVVATETDHGAVLVVEEVHADRPNAIAIIFSPKEPRILAVVSDLRHDVMQELGVLLL